MRETAKADTARKIQYVFHGVMTYAPFDPTTAAAEMNCAEKVSTAIALW